MTQQEILTFCHEHPDEAEQLISAMQRVIDFRKGRGAMLAALMSDSPVASELKETI